MHSFRNSNAAATLPVPAGIGVGEASRPQRPPLRRLNPLTNPEWDELVSCHPGATVFHTSAWARVLSDTYKYEPFYYAGNSATNPALLCLMEVNSWITGRRGIALPFTDAVAPLESEAFGFDQAFDLARNLGREQKWKSLEFRGLGNPSPSFEPSLSFLTHSLDLRRGEDELFTNVHESVRRAIRKAERSNVTVEFLNSSAGMKEYYKLHCMTRHKHGLPPQPLYFFENIQRHLLHKGHGFIALARLGSEFIAGAVFLRFGRHAAYKFGASDPRHEALRPNNLVMWRAIQKFAGSDFDSLDFGRTSMHNAGLRRYKLQWGTREESLSYVKWDFSRDQVVPGVDRAHGFQNAFFRACPMTLSRMLGGMLYPHIA